LARQLFGTDGVRGVAGELLTAELALALGRAATLQSDADAPRVLVIRDTRESGEMLEAALAAGISAAGGDVLLGGVLPTPGAPLLLHRYGFDLAAVISASHNPYRDNGIKFFAADGFKLSDEIEAKIEARLEEPVAPSTSIGRVRALHGTQEDYLRALHERFADLDLTGLDVALDCAHGATYRVAPEIFRRLGATVTALNDAPDGRNINEGCGSTHVDALAQAVVDGGHDVGFALDGDGDRVLAVDRTGTVVDGDELIALAALHLRGAGRLPGGGVAVTVMTNYGFHVAMRDAGVEVATTQVGDRYVLEALQGSDLADRHAMEKLPQRLVNVRVDDRDAAMASDELAEASEREARALEGRGRVLVRPSGTEQLVRVMVEAPSDDEAQAACDRLVAVVSGSS
jgi:phosphoglucosamine mutase